MISIGDCIALIAATFAIAVTTAGYAFKPEEFPLNKLDLLGWFVFIAAVIIWEFARHD